MNFPPVTSAARKRCRPVTALRVAFVLAVFPTGSPDGFDNAASSAVLVPLL